MSVQLRFVGLRNHLLALILCAPIAVAAGPVVGLGPYYITGIQVVSLGTLGGTESVARDVNDRGEVVGWAKDSSGVRRPFLFHNAMSDLMPGSPIIGEAHGINNNSQVVGVFAYSQDGHQYGFFRDNSNVFAILDDPSFYSCDMGVNPEAITDAGVIAGEFLSQPCSLGDPLVFGGQPARWTSWGASIQILDPSLGQVPQPVFSHGINAAGVIVGEDHRSIDEFSGAWRWKQGVAENLLPPAANPPESWYAHSARAFGINAAGTIVGDMLWDPDGLVGGRAWKRALTWNVTNPVPQRLPIFSDGLGSSAHDIDDQGFIVGWADRVFGLFDFQKHAVVWHPDIGITLLPQPLGYGEGTPRSPNYCEALAVNNRSSSTGLVKAVGYCHLNGTDRAMLWNISTARGFVTTG